MNSFIQKIADKYMVKSHISALNRCIVTPNRRAGRFIKKAIIAVLPKGGFLPQILSIDDFIFQNIRLIKVDWADLLFNLYETVNKYFDEQVDFDEFNQYATTLLHDFNDIDLNMSPGEKVFAYLSDIKAIQLWNVDGSPLTESQKKYLDFYNQLAPIYQSYREHLFSKGICYQGMGFRFFAENIDSITDKLPWEHMIFAGFNALTTSEELIFKKLKKKPKVDILWDADSMYVKDNMNEAGFYMRKHSRWDSGLKEQLQQFWTETPKNINIIGSPGSLGQTRMAAQITSEIAGDSSSEAIDTQELSQTVIVPADEKLLVPLLNSLSSPILQKTNITMGFPIEHSQAYRLMESFIKMNVRSWKVSNAHATHWKVHKTDLADVLDNGLLQNFGSTQLRSARHLALGFLDQKLVKELLREKGLDDLSSLFTNLGNQSVRLNDALSQLCHFILTKDRLGEKKIAPQETDALIQMLKVFQRLNALITQYQQPQTFTSYYSLFKLLIKTTGQSFEGQFDEGLQIMGLLETRLMDYKNVIVVSANEDVLPATTHPISFIPWDVRREHELPGIQERNAVFAYHFYRLLQRAENIYLIYSSSGKKMSGGEKSRFIKQMEAELPEINPHISISHQLMAFSETIPARTNPITIEKNEEILKQLSQLAEKGISPTQIINYVKCPLRFYLTWVVKIKEPLEIEDTIDDRILGNVIHKYLENLYKPFVGQAVIEQPIAAALKTLEKDLPAYFIETGFQGQLTEGENYLNLKNTETYLRHFLRFELNELKKNPGSLIIKALEERLERPMAINFAPYSVKISGIADRIDEKNNTIRILDYKTGFVDSKKLSLTKKENKEMVVAIFKEPEYDKPLQLFLYRWMFNAMESEVIIPGIISLRSIKNPYLFLNDDIVESHELDAGFEELMNEIFNPHIAFTQTQNEKNCSYCNFSDFCGRTQHSE